MPRDLADVLHYFLPELEETPDADLTDTPRVDREDAFPSQPVEVPAGGRSDSPVRPVTAVASAHARDDTVEDAVLQPPLLLDEGALARADVELRPRGERGSSVQRRQQQGGSEGGASAVRPQEPLQVAGNQLPGAAGACECAVLCVLVMCVWAVHVRRVPVRALCCV